MLLLLGTEYSEKCDIFSFGIILWEIFTRRLPFQDSGNDLQILWAIHNGKRPPPIQDFPTVLENLMERYYSMKLNTFIFTNLFHYFDIFLNNIVILFLIDVGLQTFRYAQICQT